MSMHNAVLAPLHNSATEYILEWPHFDPFPSLRLEEGVSFPPRAIAVTCTGENSSDVPLPEQ